MRVYYFRRAELASDEIYAVFVGVAVFSLDILADQLPERVLIVQNSEGTLVYPSFQGVSSYLHADGIENCCNF